MSIHPRTRQAIAGLLLALSAPCCLAQLPGPIELESGIEQAVTEPSSAADADLYWIAGIAGTPVDLEVRAVAAITVEVFLPDGNVLFSSEFQPDAPGTGVRFHMPKSGAYAIAVLRPVGSPAYAVKATYRDPTPAEIYVHMGTGYRATRSYIYRCRKPGDDENPRDVTTFTGGVLGYTRRKATGSNGYAEEGTGGELAGTSRSIEVAMADGNLAVTYSDVRGAGAPFSIESHESNFDTFVGYVCGPEVP